MYDSLAQLEGSMIMGNCASLYSALHLCNEVQLMLPVVLIGVYNFCCSVCLIWALSSHNKHRAELQESLLLCTLTCK